MRFFNGLTLSIVTIDATAIMDAAHLEPWATSENDDLQNGLTLCKNAHWMIDEDCGRCRRTADGWVVLAPYRFRENGPEVLRLQPYGGRRLQFADGVMLRPNPDYFARHRGFHGFG